MKSRVKYCDALRLFAILSVIAIHIFASFRDKYLILNQTYYFILTFFDSLTRTGVPLFFMITGAFMLSDKKEIPYKEFIRKRLPKLIIPFIIISFIYYINECFKIHGKVSLIMYLKLFTSGQIKYHFWFMYVIIIIYIFIPFIKKLVQNIDKKNLRDLIILIFVFGNVLGTINLYTVKYNLFSLSNFILPDLIKYINYVLLGYYVFNFDINKKSRKVIYILSIICIILIPVADIIFIDNNRNDVILNAPSMFPFIPSIGIFIYFKNNYSKWEIPDKIQKFISKSSPLIFYIYMVHVIVMEKIFEKIYKFYIPNRFIEDILLIIISFVIVFFISYIISYIINKIIDKIIKFKKI